MGTPVTLVDNAGKQVRFDDLAKEGKQDALVMALQALATDQRMVDAIARLDQLLAKDFSTSGKQDAIAGVLAGLATEQGVLNLIERINALVDKDFATSAGQAQLRAVIGSVSDAPWNRVSPNATVISLLKTIANNTAGILGSGFP